MSSQGSLRFLTGNRLELLAAHLAGKMGQESLGPLDRETIVVPTRGIGQWLEYELAAAHGIVASVDMPFPEGWIKGLAHRLGLGVEESSDSFDPRRMTWWLHDRFAALERGGDPAADLSPVALHLREDLDGRKRFQLARRLAEIFARYQLHRPVELASWEAGGWFDRSGPREKEGEPFQRALWLEMREDFSPQLPLSHRLLELVKTLRGSSFDETLLPERIAVFGASSLPRLFLDVLAALAIHRPVDVYTLFPTPGYFADIERRRGREARGGVDSVNAAEELTVELGRLGQDFFNLILQSEETGQGIEEVGFERNDESSVLGAVQASLHDLEVVPIARQDDRSLRILRCHSPLREMEVMRDEVLRAFEDGVVDDLSEVLLLVPDIGTYGPLARSVFGASIESSDGALRLPIRLADRAALEGQPYARFLMALLALAPARRTVGEVFELLHIEVVARAFDLDVGSLDGLRDRLRDAGIRWGWDPESRSRKHQLPRFEGASWREGLDRILLGFCVGEHGELVDGVLPAGDAFGSGVHEVAEIGQAAESLFALADDLVTERPLVEWVAGLRAAIERGTVASSEREVQAQKDVLDALDALRADAEAVDSKAPVGRLALIDALRNELERVLGARASLGGEIRVAELRPMRSLPAQVIGVVGLEAENFPRKSPDPGLDLAAAAPRRGDRNSRDDDRQLFLELLLSARRRLLLSFVGRSHRDASVRAPSSCVEELLDFLGVMDPVRTQQQGWIVDHPLQPFDELYGTDDSGSDRVTYDAAMIEAANAMRTTGPVRPLVDADVQPEDEEREVVVSLDDLARFWQNPSKSYCRETLGLALRWDEEEDEDEVLELSNLQKYRVRQEVLTGASDGVDAEVLAQSVGLPAGPRRALILDQFAKERADVEEKIGVPVHALESTRIRIEGPGWRVEGHLPWDGTGRVILVHPNSRLSQKHLVATLVKHLAHCVQSELKGEAGALTIALNSKASARVFRSTPDAADRFARLVEGFLEVRRRPVPFYPETSFAFAAAMEKASAAGGSVEPLEVFQGESVQKEWVGEDQGSDWSRADSDDEAVALCTRGVDDATLCGPVFREWAQFFSDLVNDLEVRKKGKGDGEGAS